MGFLCYSCQSDLEPSAFGRQDSCPKCQRDTRVCRNCAHYDPRQNNQCREEQAPRQVEKEKRNFCEWFRPNPDPTKSGQATSAADLRKAAEALFRKK